MNVRLFENISVLICIMEMSDCSDTQPLCVSLRQSELLDY